MQRPSVELVSTSLSSDYERIVNPAQITALDNGDFKDAVLDATSKYLVPTPDGEDGFLIVSGPGNSQLIARAVAAIDQARAVLSGPVAAPVLAPLLHGEIAGLSYAVWQRYRPLETGGRVQRTLRRRRYAEAILDWQREVTRQTLRPGIMQEFKIDLQTIADDVEFPDDIRHSADISADRLARGEWVPKHALHHGDFWAGNIVLVPGGESGAFGVIDWAGMQRNGYPFYDLARMSLSLRISRKRRDAHVRAMCGTVGCAPEDVTSYLLAALGHIGRHLEHFPPGRYRAMAVDVFHAMRDS